MFNLRGCLFKVTDAGAIHKERSIVLHAIVNSSCFMHAFLQV